VHQHGKGAIKKRKRGTGPNFHTPKGKKNVSINRKSFPPSGRQSKEENHSRKGEEKTGKENGELPGEKVGVLGKYIKKGEKVK